MKKTLSRFGCRCHGFILIVNHQGQSGEVRLLPLMRAELPCPAARFLTSEEVENGKIDPYFQRPDDLPTPATPSPS